jgi:hypothetical protein
MSRSDNQPSLQRGFCARVRERRPQFGYWLFGCTQMASRALVAGAGQRFESARRLPFLSLFCRENVETLGSAATMFCIL